VPLGGKGGRASRSPEGLFLRAEEREALNFKIKKQIDCPYISGGEVLIVVRKNGRTREN